MSGPLGLPEMKSLTLRPCKGPKCKSRISFMGPSDDYDSKMSQTTPLRERGEKSGIMNQYLCQ